MLFFYFNLCHIWIIFICFLDDDDESDGDEDSDNEGNEDASPGEEDETPDSQSVDDFLFSNFTPSQAPNVKDDGYNSDGTPFLQSQKSGASSSSKSSTRSSPAPSPSSPPVRVVHAKTGGLKKTAAPPTPPIDASSFLSQLVFFI